MKNSTIIKNGLFLGALWIAVYLITYLINPEIVWNTAFGTIISIVIPIIFIRIAMKEEREKNEGMLSFGEAFVVGMGVFFIGSLMYSIVNSVHLSIDTEFREQGEQIAIDTAKNMSKSIFDLAGMSEEDQQKALAEIDENPPKITTTQMFIGFLGSLFFGAIISLIAAAVLKKS